MGSGAQRRLSGDCYAMRTERSLTGGRQQAVTSQPFFFVRGGAVSFRFVEQIRRFNVPIVDGRKQDAGHYYPQACVMKNG